MSIGRSNLSRPLLKTMGVTDAQLRENWGDLAAVNLQKSDPQAVRKLYERVKPSGTETGHEAQSKAVAEAFNAMQLDPEVTKRTLGQPFDRVTPEAILATTKRLLGVSRGEQEPDDRDAMAYQTLMGPEDLFAGKRTAAPSGISVHQRHPAMLELSLWRFFFLHEPGVCGRPGRGVHPCGKFGCDQDDWRPRCRGGGNGSPLSRPAVRRALL